MKNRIKKLREVKLYSFTSDFPDVWKYYISPKELVLFSPTRERYIISLDSNLFKQSRFCNGVGIQPQDIKNCFPDSFFSRA